MMRAIDLSDKAAKGLAQLMVRGLGEIGSRSADNLTSLETLAIVSMRMLVAAQALQLDKLTDLGLDYASGLEEISPRSMFPLRSNLELAFNNETELNETGITFHTVQ
jgi:hypothetical protein